MGLLEQTISEIRPVDVQLLEVAQRRLDSLTKPKGSLGRLEDFARRIVAITRKETPSVDKKAIIVMAGDHGVTQEGVSAYPQEVTRQMVYNFLEGGAGINVLARHIGARVVVVDMGVAADLEPRRDLVSLKVNHGTRNIVEGPAMTRDEALRSITNGIKVFNEEFERGIDIVGTGDMGIGNTTPSSAIASVFTGLSARDVTGRGTGIDDEQLETKIKVIERAIELNQPDPDDPLDVLAKVGGFEIGGLAGVVLAAASKRIPMVIDGFISGAGALIATELAPRAKDYIFAAHRSAEVGHKALLERMGLDPILDLNMRLGEGTGAVLAMNLIEAGVKVLSEMATFSSAGVSERLQ